MPRVRKIHKLSSNECSIKRVIKCNYMCIFRNVRNHILIFTKQLFNPALFPLVDQHEFLREQREILLPRFMRFSYGGHVRHIHPTRFDKLFHIIGFTLWCGMHWRFPKKLSKEKFDKDLCSPYIDIAMDACKDIEIIIQSTPFIHNAKTILFIIRKIKNIFS